MTLMELAVECLADEDCTCTPAKGIIRKFIAEVPRLQKQSDTWRLAHDAIYTERNDYRAQVAAHEESIQDLKSRLSSSLSDVAVLVKERDAERSLRAAAEGDTKTLQEMTTLLVEGSGAISKLSASPAVAHLCMRLRQAEAAEGEVERLKAPYRVSVQEMVESHRVTWWVCLDRPDRPLDAKPWAGGRITPYASEDRKEVDFTAAEWAEFFGVQVAAMPTKEPKR